MTTAMTLVDSPLESFCFATTAPCLPERVLVPTTLDGRATGSTGGFSTTAGRGEEKANRAWPGCAHEATASSS